MNNKPRIKRARTDYTIEKHVGESKDQRSVLKVLILGYGEHGKDEFAARLAERIGLQFTSSSQFACDRIVFPWFQEHLPAYYADSQECFAGRRDWRALWHYLICQYNLEDKSRLAREIMTENDAYVGMRCSEELEACIKEELFTHILWIDAGRRVPPENLSSNSISYNPDAMCMIDNSGDLDQLQEEVESIVKVLGF